MFDSPQELVYLLCSACSSPKSGQTSVLFRSSPPTAEGTGEGYSPCLGATWQVHLNVVRSKINIVAKAKNIYLYETEWDVMSRMLGKDLWKG